MTQEEKEILLKDLCARLLYEVKCSAFNLEPVILLGVDNDILHLDYPIHDEGDGYYNIEYVKPYLRPMSSMTEEEREEYNEWHLELESGRIKDWKNADYIDWLNAHNFDYRGLIVKGLALEAPEGMYNLNKK